MNTLIVLVLLPWVGAAAALLGRGATWGPRAALTTSAAGLVAALVLVAQVLGGGPAVALAGWLRADALSALILVLVAFLALATQLHGHDYMRVVRAIEPHDARWRPGRYEALGQVLLAALVLALLTDDLALMWIALEGATLASAVLVGYYRRPGAIEAAWKMLMLCSVGIALALLGTVLLHHASARALAEGSSALRWSAVIAGAGQLDARVVQLAFLFALVGYGAKVGLAPMHGWLPDAYAHAPAPAAALLATAFTAVTVHALLRFHAIAVACIGPAWSSELLTWFGVASLVVAVPMLVLQGETKRLLAWSSLEHTGLVVLAVGLGSPLAVFAGLLHLVTQSLAKALGFLLAGNLLRASGSGRMDHTTGLLRSHPPTAVLLLITGIGLAGLPPAGTFLSEWLVLTGGLATPRRAGAWVAVAALGVAFLGLAFHLSRMLMGEPLRPFRDALPARARAPMMALATALIMLGVWLPAPVRALLEQAARVVRP